jgi:hypothetical protein
MKVIQFYAGMKVIGEGLDYDGAEEGLSAMQQQRHGDGGGYEHQQETAENPLEPTVPPPERFPSFHKPSVRIRLDCRRIE